MRNVRLALLWFAITALGALALRHVRRTESPRADSPAAVARGREIYAGEGCVHCHSQYVRPLDADTERWGRAGKGITALVGNRRQGPDLANIGARADATYLKLHLTSPQSVKPGTVMPSYAHLFAPGDTRGDDLIAYLLSLRPPAE